MAVIKLQKKIPAEAAGSCDFIRLFKRENSLLAVEGKNIAAVDDAGGGLGLAGNIVPLPGQQLIDTLDAEIAHAVGVLHDLSLIHIFTISIDCDGQDDINAMDGMVDAYLDGCDVVYGVRSKRDTDTFFKRFTAESFYKLLNAMGAEVVYNHADYRLMSARVLQEFAKFKEVNLFLRGMVPLVGFKSTSVAYERHERIAGESHYPLSKMLSLAFDGITSLSIKPIRFITGFGVIVALISFIGVIWAMVEAILGLTVSGWASMTSIICFVSGVQLICLGVIGEYIGKIYMETKHRPRYIISETTPNFEDAKEDNA